MTTILCSELMEYIPLSGRLLQGQVILMSKLFMISMAMWNLLFNLTKEENLELVVIGFTFGHQSHPR